MPRKRTYAIIIVWALLIAWWLRYYQTYAGSPIPGGWGVNIDWTRHDIAQNGRIIPETDARSVLSSYRGAQSYDWTAITLGIVSVVMGGSLEGNLTALNTLPVVGLLIIPNIIFLMHNQFVNNAGLLSTNGVLLLSLSLFPASQVVFKTSLGWYPEPYSTSLLLLTLIMAPRVHDSWAHYVIFIILMVATLNSYHTWVFFFLLIISTIIILEFFYRQVVTHQVEPLPGLNSAVLLGILFYATGVSLSGRFEELIGTLAMVTVTGQDEFFAAAGSDLISATASHALENIGIRRFLVLINYISTFGIVILYSITQFSGVIDKDTHFLRNSYNRLILFSLLAFPIIVGMFYALGGISTAINRTQYIGVYFAVFCAIVLLSQQERWHHSITIVLVVTMILTAVGGVALYDSTYTAPHTHGEAAAIEFTGQNVQSDHPVFSDGRMGMPLLYYSHDALVGLDVTNPGWEERAKAIFYGSSNMSTKEAIKSSVELSISNNREENIYVLLSTRLVEDGPQLLTFQLRPAPNTINRFEHNPEFNKIYSNGNSSLSKSK